MLQIRNAAANFYDEGMSLTEGRQYLSDCTLQKPSLGKTEASHSRMVTTLQLVSLELRPNAMNQRVDLNHLGN